LLKQPLDRCLDLTEFGLSDRGSGDQHHVPPRSDGRQTKPHDLSQPAAYTVTNHGPANPLADRKAKAARLQGIGRNAQHNQAMSPTLALAAGLVELTAPAQPVIPFQGLPSPLSIGNRWGQALTAAQATSLDNVTPIAGAHALTKTMNT